MRQDRGGDRRGGFQRSFAPVKVGDELDAKIEAVGEKGDGIAKKDGFVLFVPGTKQGDNVRIRVTRVLQKVGFAEVVGQAAAKEEGSQESSEGSSEGSSEQGYQESSEESEESSDQEYSGGEDSENFGED